MYEEMTHEQLENVADEETQRLFEKLQYYSNPGMMEIDTRNVNYWQEEFFCRMVEAKLLQKGEPINRKGRYFKSKRY